MPHSLLSGGYWSDFSKALWQLDNLSSKVFLLHASSPDFGYHCFLWCQEICLQLFSHLRWSWWRGGEGCGEAAGLREESVHKWLLSVGYSAWVIFKKKLLETSFHSHFSPISFPDLGFFEIQKPGLCKMLRVLAFAFPYIWDSLPILFRVRALL